MTKRLLVAALGAALVLAACERVVDLTPDATFAKQPDASTNVPDAAEDLDDGGTTLDGDASSPPPDAATLPPDAEPIDAI